MAKKDLDSMAGVDYDGIEHHMLLKISFSSVAQKWLKKSGLQ